MPARVIVLGLDAAEATLIERWAAQGKLPHLRTLIARGVGYRLANSLETLPGAIWPELTTGRACGKVGQYFHPRQLHTGEARVRPILAEEINPAHDYWSVASRAGRRVAAIDQVQTVLSPDLNGVQLLEWGLHDRNFAIASQPPTLLSTVRARYGDHPVHSCDQHHCEQNRYEELLQHLLDGASRKTAMLVDLLRHENWDVFAATYAETHCVGHQFWHFHDSRHPRYDPAAPPHLVNAIRAVYQRIDNGIGTILQAAGPQACVVVVASHGMGLYTGGYQLLPEVLIRLGMGSNRRHSRTPKRHSALQATVRSWYRRLRGDSRLVPPWVRPFVHPLPQTRLGKSFLGSLGSLEDPLESPHTTAATLENNRCGAVRLNMKGREPFGHVETGAEAEALLIELRRELLALTHPASGEPIVAKVVSATEAFGPDHHPDIPDLIVVFRADLGQLEACTSERVGHIQVPLFNPHIPRSGDHTVESRLWITGPSIPHRTGLQHGSVLDLAPTVLTLLGVPVPEEIDGRPLSVIDLMQNG